MLGVCACAADARLALALVCALAIAQAHAKLEEVAPGPFTFTARYGRAADRFITPRMDRWMLSNRYGKRSDSFAIEGDPHLQGFSPTLRENRFSCVYTGVLELYRCTRERAPLHERGHLARRSEIEPE